MKEHNLLFYLLMTEIILLIIFAIFLYESFDIDDLIKLKNVDKKEFKKIINIISSVLLTIQCILVFYFMLRYNNLIESKFNENIVIFYNLLVSALMIAEGIFFFEKYDQLNIVVKQYEIIEDDWFNISTVSLCLGSILCLFSNYQIYKLL